MITQKRLAEVLEYSPNDGLFRYVAPRGNKRIGDVAGARDKDGYFQANIKVNGRTHYLGLFRTAKEASNAYMDAKGRLHTCFRLERAG